MYSYIDEQEWRWRQILTRQIHPDDAPSTDDEEEDEENEDAD